MLMLFLTIGELKKAKKDVGLKSGVADKGTYSEKQR